MAFVEILHGRLWQADANSTVFVRLVERNLTPVMVIDLQEFEVPGLPADGSIVYVRWPIEDGPVPDVRLLFALEQAACRYIEDGGRVVTMCAQGRNRSGLMSALIVARLSGCDGFQAVRTVQRKVPEALSNQTFVDWLRKR